MATQTNNVQLSIVNILHTNTSFKCLKITNTHWILIKEQLEVQ